MNPHYKKLKDLMNQMSDDQLAIFSYFCLGRFKGQWDEYDVEYVKSTYFPKEPQVSPEEVQALKDRIIELEETLAGYLELPGED